MLGHGIALAFVDTSFDTEPPAGFDIEQRGRSLPATVVADPLHPPRPVGLGQLTRTAGSHWAPAPVLN